MIGPIFMIVLVTMSFAIASDGTESEGRTGEYINVDPVWEREVFKLLKELINEKKHSLPPDWSLEASDNERTRDLEHHRYKQPERADDDKYVGRSVNDDEPSHLNLRQSLMLWENVERKIRDLLTSPKEGQRLTLKDRSTHTAAVMSSVLGLAVKLLETCSTLEYVKSYRETVSSNLMQTFANPAETINTQLDLLETIRKTIANVRVLVLRNQIACTQRSNCPTLHQLNKQKQLAQALGSLARTYLASKSLQRAISSYDEAAYLLNGQKDQSLYVLAVKSARVLKLLSNRYTCDLPLEVQLPLLPDSEKNLNRVTLKYRYPILIG